MEFRKLPHGDEEISTIGLGLANLYVSPDSVVEETIACAVENGINFYDLCGGRMGIYEVFGKVTKGCRKRLYTQMHFGAVYPGGNYAFSRNLDQIRRSFEKVLRAAQTDYTDFGLVHCIDEDEDYRKVMASGGLFDYMRSLKEQGVVRHLGFSTHTPAIARRFLETGETDLFMFSLNPAYDYSRGRPNYGGGQERMELYQEAERRGAGITVMKPFAGGQLLDAEHSPLNFALSHYQCLQYALDRPAVLACLPGVGSVRDVRQLLGFYEAGRGEKDYSVLGKAAPSEVLGRCVYCNHCAPCPAGIDIGLINKYYDLAKFGDELAASHYKKLSIRADACIRCGHCEQRCPFQVRQMQRMEEISRYFSAGRL